MNCVMHLLGYQNEKGADSACISLHTTAWRMQEDLKRDEASKAALELKREKTRAGMPWLLF